MTPADPLRAAMAEVLDAAAGATRDARFRHAAAILRGNRAGRRPLDDAEPLRLVRSLVGSGARSRRWACEFVATLYAPDHGVEAMRDRLQRKLRRK